MIHFFSFQRTLSKVELVIINVQEMTRSLGSMVVEINSSTNPNALLSNFVGKLSASIHSPVSGGLLALLVSFKKKKCLYFISPLDFYCF